VRRSTSATGEVAEFTFSRSREKEIAANQNQQKCERDDSSRREPHPERETALGQTRRVILCPLH